MLHDSLFHSVLPSDDHDHATPPPTPVMVDEPTANEGSGK